MISNREETEKKAKKKAELQAKEQAKREAEEAKKLKEAEGNNMRGVSRPLWTPPKLLLLIAVVIILVIIGYGIWLSIMIP